MTRARCPVGDAPRWVLRAVLAAYVGITLTFLVVVVGGGVLWTSSTGRQDVPGQSWIGWIVTAVVVAVLLRLLRDYRRRRPLTRADRTYYRSATLFVGLYGALGSGAVATVVAVLMLVHSYVLDREVRVEGAEHRAG